MEQSRLGSACDVWLRWEAAMTVPAQSVQVNRATVTALPPHESAGGSHGTHSPAKFSPSAPRFSKPVGC